jgi:hypothetical protein
LWIRGKVGGGAIVACAKVIHTAQALAYLQAIASPIHDSERLRILPIKRQKLSEQLPSPLNAAIIFRFPDIQGEFTRAQNLRHGQQSKVVGGAHYFTGVALEQGLSLVTVASSSYLIS